MEKTFFSACLFIMTSNLFAQFTAFNLSDFQLPDIHRNQLDLNIDAGISGLSSKYSINDLNSPKYINNSTQVDLMLTYKNYINTRTIQRELNSYISFDPYLSRHKSENSRLREFQLSPDLYFNMMNRFYFNDKIFFEPDIVLNSNYYLQNNKQDSISDKTSNQIIEIEIPLLAGKGRIEQIQDARLAIYILDELEKIDRLSRILDNNEILEFASFISTLKNDRYFDYRLKRIEDIERVDSFLQSRALITKVDARYFTSIYDNWEYADGPVRENGNRISAGFVPVISYQSNYSNKEINSNESKQVNTETGLKFVAQFISRKPINLYWQRGWNAQAYYWFSKNWLQEENNGTRTTSDFIINQFSGSAGYMSAYYPNSRTNIEAHLDMIIKKIYTNYPELSPQSSSDQLFIYPKLSIVLNYYISERTRLRINYYASISYDETQDKLEPVLSQSDRHSSFYHAFRINFAYSIF